MKQGRSLIDVATELERQRSTRRDYVAPTTALAMKTTPGEAGSPAPVVLDGLNGDAYALNEHAHGQLAEQIRIPKVYYDRMRVEAPDLLVQNVNAWFQRQPSRRMVRTLDGHVRAWLSPSYRILGNDDLAEIVLPELQSRKCQVVSMEITERRMYLKAICPDVQMEVAGSRQKGDVVQAGVVISNSEVGAGALLVQPLIFRLVCTNGMIAQDNTLKQYHVGRAIQGSGVFEILSDEARRADDRAFWLALRDVVRSAFDRDVFSALVQRTSEAVAERIETANLERVVELTTRKVDLPDRVRGSVLRNLIEGGDLSRWGLVNAITAAANTEDDYEIATDLERAGGKVLELPARDWRVLSAAA